MDVARDLETIRRLAEPAGRALVAELGPYRAGEALAVLESLRSRGVDPDLAAAALTQARLRDAARPRLGAPADEMLFTADGAEQATRTVVADLHAGRFAAAGVRRVADLGCGIGADSLALVRAGVDVLSVERDPITAAVARANLPPAPAAQVRCADVLHTDLSDVDALFADPARRAGGRRIQDPERWSPPLSAVIGLRDGRPMGVKVAPGMNHRDLGHAHARWVSVDGDLVEAGLWYGAAAPEGPGRGATVVRDGVARHLLERPDAPGADRADAPVRAAGVAPLGEYLIEPDAAVLRAGLVARLGELTGAGIVSADIAYLTTDLPPERWPGHDDPAALGTAYRILDVLPFQLKRRRAYRRERDVGALTIKKRGTAVEPEQLRARLGLRGSDPATIVLTRVAGAQSVLLVEPLPSPGAPRP